MTFSVSAVKVQILSFKVKLSSKNIVLLYRGTRNVLFISGLYLIINKY